ncbi:MAG: hypothetical protein ABI986_06390, partial [Chloroflexota bacterium]
MSKIKIDEHMIFRTIANFIFCLALLLGTGCQKFSQLSTPLPTKTPPVVIVAPTTASISTPTETPQKVTLPDDSIIQNQCPEFSNQLEAGFARGTLVVFHRDLFSGPDGSEGFLDLETSRESPSDGGSVSPSRNRLATYILNENDLSESLVVQTVGET